MIVSGVLLVIAIVAVIMVLYAFGVRTVVSTNSVHIVQSSSKTTSYGRGQAAGNVYYHWAAWMPIIGVRVTVLPVSVFDRKLMDYAAYDQDRVPFVIDVVGFFRISDSNMAAERVKDFNELEAQLEPILQGAARTILATSKIDEILGQRSVFAEKFTTEVTKDLTSWGVEPVKSIELMDIRDAQGSQVISNIMAKKKSFIEMESRIAVAGNLQAAKTAEISAQREVNLRDQEAQEIVGQRTAAKDQAVGIANQKAEQAIQEEAKETAIKLMAVNQVQVVRAAEIDRDARVVAADLSRQQIVIKADADKQQQTLFSQGKLEATRNEATGIQLEGEAKAIAAKLMQLAPVEAQITLAKEIGSNQGYQDYLVRVKTVEATQQVGIAQADALKSANVRIIATASDPAQGMTLAKIGSSIAAAVEAFRATAVPEAAE